jgi:hypothetical protein
VTWTDLGLPSYRAVNAVALDKASRAIYCGLQNAGVAIIAPEKNLSCVLDLLILN